MVEDLIQRARRRLLLNETLAQTAFVAAVMAGGFALILLVGTRYLEWWSLALFAVVGIGLGIYRILKASPTPYAAALQLDSSAELNDSLSTAFYFTSTKADSAFVAVQRTQAERAAAGVVLEEAVPFTRPPALYAMAALAVFASLLIGLRFAGDMVLIWHAPLRKCFSKMRRRRARQKARLYGSGPASEAGKRGIPHGQTGRSLKS